MRAAIYIRVSTSEQAAEGYSLAAQQKRAKRTRIRAPGELRLSGGDFALNNVPRVSIFVSILRLKSANRQ